MSPAGAQRLVWRGGVSFEGEDSRGFRFAISGDRDEAGAKPSDLLPLSLAACLAYDVVVVLRKKRQDLRTLQVVVASEQEEEPPQRFARMALRFEVGGEIDPAAARRALEIAEKNCPVLASLASKVRVDTGIEVVTVP
jgi:putative redox protein